MSGSWGLSDLAGRLFLAGCCSGLFNAPNMALAMAHTPRPLLATAGASTSLARQIGLALGPALATLAWSASSYVRGVGGAMALSAPQLGTGRHRHRVSAPTARSSPPPASEGGSP